MVLDLIVIKTDDGYTGDVPSMKECESWAHNEDEVIENVVSRLRFFLNLSDDHEIKVDRARKTSNKIVYKLVFDK